MFAMVADGALVDDWNELECFACWCHEGFRGPLGQKEGPAPVAVRVLLLCGLVAGVR